MPGLLQLLTLGTAFVSRTMNRPHVCTFYGILLLLLLSSSGFPLKFKLSMCWFKEISKVVLGSGKSCAKMESKC